MTRIAHNNWVLVHKDGKAVHIGDEVRDFRNDIAHIQGGRPPHHAGSTGRVWTTDNSREFFPSVYGLDWVEETETVIN